MVSELTVHRNVDNVSIQRRYVYLDVIGGELGGGGIKSSWIKVNPI